MSANRDYPTILARVDNLYSIAQMIENEGNCDIRKVMVEGARLLIKELDLYYNAAPEDVTPVEVVYTLTDEGKKEVEEPPKKKRGGRKKKEEITEPEPEVESGDSSPLDPEPEPEMVISVHPPGMSLSLVYDSGCLDKRFPRMQNIIGITDESLESSNISPVVLANSCTSIGEHPFFKGPASFIWYLGEERRKFYLAGLFDDEKFYPSILDLIDAVRLKEADVVGPDMSFVSCVIDTNTMLPVEPTLAQDDPDAINRLRDGGMKRFLDDIQGAGLDNEQAKTLARFMTRYGIDSQVEEDLGTVAALHGDPMEKNPDVRF